MKKFMSDKKNVVIILLTVAVSLEFAFIIKLRHDVNENFQKIESLQHVVAKLSNDVSDLRQNVLSLEFDFKREKSVVRRNEIFEQKQQ